MRTPIYTKMLDIDSSSHSYHRGGLSNSELRNSKPVLLKKANLITSISLEQMKQSSTYLPHSVSHSMTVIYQVNRSISEIYL